MQYRYFTLGKVEERLGLLRRDPQGGLVIANPIYREVIPRVLVGGTQDSLSRIAPS
jgi:hypothetical protein